MRHDRTASGARDTRAVWPSARAGFRGRVPRAPRTTELPRAGSPLFQRHRRGTYRTGRASTIDATLVTALETDDPTVPEPREYEINLFTAADLSKARRALTCCSSMPIMEFCRSRATNCPCRWLKFPSRPREKKEPYHTAWARQIWSQIQLHTNDHRGLAIAVYPQVEFEAPRTGAVEGPGRTRSNVDFAAARMQGIPLLHLSPMAP
jgi:hypothetical protein